MPWYIFANPIAKPILMWELFHEKFEVNFKVPDALVVFLLANSVSVSGELVSGCVYNLHYYTIYEYTYEYPF